MTEHRSCNRNRIQSVSILMMWIRNTWNMGIWVVLRNRIDIWTLDRNEWIIIMWRVVMRLHNQWNI